jgi:hypothetical protein
VCARNKNSVPHVALRQLADALIACGYTSLDAQAKALGVPRSTAWTIVKGKHKMGRLSQKVRTRMLSNPELPCEVRALLEPGFSTKVSDHDTFVAPNAGRRASSFANLESKW